MCRLMFIVLLMLALKNLNPNENRTSVWGLLAQRSGSSLGHGRGQRGPFLEWEQGPRFIGMLSVLATS